MITLILPTEIIIPKKTKKDKRIALNKNIERNLHWIVYNQVKQKFSEAIKFPPGFKLPPPPLHFHYKYFHGSKHKPDLDNCTGILKKFIQDCLCDLEYLEEDNVDYIVSSSEEFGGYFPKAGYCELTISSKK